MDLEQVDLDATAATVTADPPTNEPEEKKKEEEIPKIFKPYAPFFSIPLFWRQGTRKGKIQLTDFFLLGKSI